MEKPIIFNTEMVQAILDDRKKMTRRVIKPQPKHKIGLCPYTETGWANTDAKDKCTCKAIKLPYQVGDILWVREKFNDTETNTVLYAADKDFIDKGCKEVDGYLFMEDEIKWKPSIHMPKSLARIWLKVTDVRVERLQEILCEDMKKEGCIPHNIKGGQWQQWQQEYFKPLWDSLNTKRGYGWDINPWVWVIEFERVRKDAKMDGD